MGDISKITLPNNEEYNLKDAQARQDISTKTNKVQNAINGNFAALDSNGNLTDSGHKHSDYLTSHQSLAAYRTAAAQDIIDAGKETAGLGLTSASVGDLIRVKTVDANGKPTSWQKAPLCDITTNQNLLINWYFVYGKTINTNNPYSNVNTFPINEQGQTSYINQGYCIDRWLMRGSDNGSVAISPTGDSVAITLNTNTESGDSYKSLDQILDKEKLQGKTVTLSCLVTGYVNDGAEFLTLGIWSTDNIVSHTNVIGTAEITATGLLSITVDIPSQVSNTYLKAGVFMRNSAQYTGSVSIKIQAIKLELGSYQTLAHNEGTEENPDWVLNEIPDYGEELVKCNMAAGKTVEYTDRFLVLESTYEYAHDLTWTAIGGGIAYSAKMQFTYNGATATTVPGYRAVAATIARFSSYRPDYQWVPYIQYNTGEVCIYSAVGASPTDFIASSHISVRAIFEKT